MEIIDTVVRFLNCYMLDSNYNNTPFFNTKEKQIQWFNQFVLWVDENFDYQRKNNNLKVGYSLSELSLVNYLIIDNSNGERFFYFITDKEYISDNVTNCKLKLDLIQTYIRELSFKDCLIERSHIQEYTVGADGKIYPTEYVKFTTEEGLNTGNYVLKNSNDIYNYVENGCYIFSSSERLGVSDEERINFLDELEGGEEGGTNFSNGRMDKNGLRMIKSFEGFASEPYDIGDGTLTTGYGCTSEFSTEAYNSLLPSCTEVQASEVLGDYAYNSYSLPIKQQLDNANYNWEYMTQDLFNAMVSFAWNSGTYAMSIEWVTLWNMILQGYNKTNPTELKNQWAITNIMVGSEFEEGLRSRRTREGLISVGEYDYTNFVISNVTEGGTITDNNGYGHIPKEYQ